MIIIWVGRTYLNTQINNEIRWWTPKLWILSENWAESVRAPTINRKKKKKKADPFPNNLPGAFIFLPGQLVPPGKQQSEGSELLGVKRPFLLPLQLQIWLLCVYRLHIFLLGGSGAKLWQMSCRRLQCGNLKIWQQLKRLWHYWLEGSGTGVKMVIFKCQFNVQDVWSEICANLQGNVFALVPDTLQKARLPMVKVQQLCPHTVVDIKEVVGVCPGILNHLLWQGARRPSYNTFYFHCPKINSNFNYFKRNVTNNLKCMMLFCLMIRETLSHSPTQTITSPSTSH